MRTTFAQRVRKIVARIPEGEVRSYAQIADAAGNPRACRAVGNIMNANRDPNVPCHRVVRSDGAVGGYAFGASKKVVRLRAEGVEIRDGRVVGMDVGNPRSR